MKILLASGVAMLTFGFFQMPATPPMKMGLWESTSTMKMNMPDMPAGMPGMGPRTTTVHTCMTPESYQKALYDSKRQKDCTVTNQTWTPKSYSFDISCPSSKATGHGQFSFEGDAGHGSVHIDMSPGGRSMTTDMTMEMKYLGASCGSVTPDKPEIVK